MADNAYCMGCMKPKGNEGHCPTCGWLEGSRASSLQHLPPGTLFHGKYLVGRALGQGGFGITYIARDLYLDRVLAIKEYFPRELATRDQDGISVAIYHGQQMEQYQYGMEKFLEEGRTLAKFEGHPNIVSVQDFFESNQTAYLVMPYIEGVALSEYLKTRNGILAFEQALQIMMPVMDALSAVHEAGMLHRDISPDNIYISRQGRVMILDFGAARHAMNQQNRQYSIILKPGYAPPEQYRQKGNQGPWTDVYAVAATFFHAVTGTMPPDGLERMEYDSLQWPEWILHQLSEDRRRAVEGGLAPRPEQRFQSITDFQNALLEGASQVETPAEEPQTFGYGAPGQNRSTTGRESVDVLASRPVQAHHQGSESPRSVLTIGRAADNDIVIQDETVSRYHARLARENHQWVLVDLQSTHGTYLNGSRVTAPAAVQQGSYLQFSHAKLYFDGVYLLSERGEMVHPLFNQEAPASFPGADREHGSFQKQVLPGAAASGLNKKALFIMGSMAAIVVMLTGIYLVVQAGRTPPMGDRNTTQQEMNQPAVNLTTGTIPYDGGVYTGQMLDGKPHGEGTWTQDRSATSGAFGQLATSGERIYEGQWENGLKQGLGVMRHPDGSIQRGRWEADVYVGRE